MASSRRSQLLPPWKQGSLTQYAKILRKPSAAKVTSLLLAIFIVLRVRQRLARLRSSVMSSDPKKLPVVPGFTAVTDQIFVRDPEPSEKDQDPDPAHSDDPDVVLIYGSGDGLPKHVAKYAEGFRALFPRAKQVLVLSPIPKAMFSTADQRAASMRPIVEILFPSAADKANSSSTRLPPPPPPTVKILAHTMSNTGAINYSATLDAHRRIYGTALQHQLLSMDSTPGSTDFTWHNLQRWSRAMALGTAGWFPWPFAVTQVLMGVALCINGVREKALGRVNAGALARRNAKDPTFMSRDVRTLYLYSREDDLIGYEDIEAHVAESRQTGWVADTVMFEGSGHVGHMRQHPEQYWAALGDSWKKAVAGPSAPVVSAEATAEAAVEATKA